MIIVQFAFRSCLGFGPFASQVDRKSKSQHGTVEARSVARPPRWALKIDRT